MLIKKILEINIRNKGLPKQINRYNLDKTQFIETKNNLVNDIVSYFYKDPDIWKLPAKNYFLRICLALYCSIKFNKDFYECLDTNDILPYNDLFTRPYNIDKYIYDSILSEISINKIVNSYGYKKTIEIMGYLYNTNFYD